jgi:hypothetical protein
MRCMEKPELPADNCRAAPASQVTIYTQVLHRACQMLGGVEPLAARLRVPVSSLYQWLDGEDEPPTSVFLKAVDIVLPPWSAEDDAHARDLRASRTKKPLANQR